MVGSRLVAGALACFSAQVSLRRSHRLGVFVAACLLWVCEERRLLLVTCRFAYTSYWTFVFVCVCVSHLSSCFCSWVYSVLAIYLSILFYTLFAWSDLPERLELMRPYLTHATEQAHDFTSWRQKPGTTMRNGDQIRTTQRSAWARIIISETRQQR